MYFEDKESKQCSNVKNGVAEREVLAEPDLQHFPPSQIKETTIVPLLPRKDTSICLNKTFFSNKNIKQSFQLKILLHKPYYRLNPLERLIERKLPYMT